MDIECIGNHVKVRQVVAFFIIPTYALFRDKNYPVAIIFIITAVVTAARRYLNAIVALEQLGSLEGLEMDNEDRELNWRERYRLGKVVDDISSSNKNTFSKPKTQSTDIPSATLS